MKKIISILLTFVIAFSVSCSVFAANDQIPDINSGWYWPASSNERTITSEFGRARPEKNYPDKVHQAIDISIDEGKPVYATRAGEVVETFDSCKGSHNSGQCSCEGGKYYGNYVVIYHGKWNGSKIYSMYMHLKSVNVNKGAVYARQQIGTVGNTGPSNGAHLHFQISKDSKNPKHNSMTQTENSYVNTNPNIEMFTNKTFSHNRIGNTSYPNSKYGNIVYIMDGVETSKKDSQTTNHICTKYETYTNGKTKILGACKECHKAFNWHETFRRLSETYELQTKNYKVKIYKSPYEDAKCISSSKVIKNISVVGTLTNAYGSQWYAIAYNYQDDTDKQCYSTAYVYGKNIENNYRQSSSNTTPIEYGSANTSEQEHTHNYNYNNGMCYCGAVKATSQQTNAASTLKINLTKYPVQHTQGNNFGLRGTISSNYKIKKIYGYIKQNGNVIQCTEDSPNAKSVDVRDKNLNNNLVFETLGAGNYTLEVYAVDASGNGITVTKNFTVVGQTVKAESTLSINLDKYPVTLNAGSGFGLRGSITSNYNIALVKGYVINSSGQTILSSKDTPNSTSMDIRYANLNDDLVFNNLGAGNYTMKVVATDNSGRTVEVSKGFSVISNTSSNNSTLAINLQKYPVTLDVGSSYGLRGSITSNYNISVVRGYVINSNGQTVLSSKDTPNSTYMDIKPAHLNADLIFNNLSAGNYTMRVVAVDASGRTVEATKNFTVKAKDVYVDNSPNGNGVTGTVAIPSSWENLSIRSGPSTNYQIVGSMNNGAKCTVYPNKTSNGWYYVNYNGIWGYASGNQINLNNSSNANTRTGIVNIPSSWTDLSIRTGPSTNYQIVGGMPHGARCTVYPDKASNGWYYVEYNGVSGYAAGNRINLQ